MRDTYWSERIPVREPSSTERYQCFDLVSSDMRSVPSDTGQNMTVTNTSDFDLYQGVPVGMHPGIRSRHTSRYGPALLDHYLEVF